MPACTVQYEYGHEAIPNLKFSGAETETETEKRTCNDTFSTLTLISHAYLHRLLAENSQGDRAHTICMSEPLLHCISRTPWLHNQFSSEKSSHSHAFKDTYLSFLLIQLNPHFSTPPRILDKTSMFVRPDRDIAFKRERDTHPTRHHRIQRLLYLPIHFLLRDIKCP